MSKSIAAYSSDERVQRYDADMDLLHPLRHEMIALGLDLLPFEKNAPLRGLDLGAGTGLFTLRFLERFPRARVRALDGSEAMVELARARLAAHQDRITLDQAPLEELAPTLSGDAGYDVVYSSYALHHLSPEAKTRLWTTVHAHLNPGGWVINADLVRSEFPEVEEIGLQARVHGIHRRNQGRDPRFPDPEGIRAFITRARENEADQPLTVGEDLDLLRAAGISRASMFWQEYFEVVMGGSKE